MIKVCECCGVEFEAKRSSAKFCSAKCRVRNARNSFAVRECIICGKEFVPVYGKEECCGKECSEILLSQNKRFNNSKNAAMNNWE